jgi:hypothetical protein
VCGRSARGRAICVGGWAKTGGCIAIFECENGGDREKGQKKSETVRLSLTVRWARLGCTVLTNTTSPQMPQKPPGKGGWDTATTTRQSARDARADSRSFLEALSAGRTQRSLRRPDMVIWAVYACMLGRTERSARLREPSFTPN